MRLTRLRRDRRGETWVEYLILIAVLGLAAVTSFRGLESAFASASSKNGDALVAMSSLQTGPGGDLPGGATPQPPTPEPDQKKKCSGFFSCVWEKATSGPAGAFDLWWDYVFEIGRGAWDDVAGIWDLIKDPGSLIDAGKYIWNHPLDAAKMLVWDEDSQNMWDEGNYTGAIGRTVWNVGSWFIPGYDIGKAFSKLGKLGKLGKLEKLEKLDDVAKVDVPEVPKKVPDSCPATGCTEPGKCFAAGTPVHTEHGLRAIEDVEEGDFVWSRDDHNGELALQRVTHRFVTPHRSVLALTLEDPSSQAEELHVTPEHPFWTARGWTAAKALTPGESVKPLEEGEWVRVVALESLDERVTVYNFEVEDFHTYFVGSEGVWVHNKYDDEKKPGDEDSPLNDDKTFKDPELEARYQAYIKRNEARGRYVRDREDWKKVSDEFANGPTARGNKFNETRRDAYPYNEVNLSDKKRVDSYDPKKGEIVERKAVDFDDLDPKVFQRYLDETKTKYPEGKIIRSDKYPELDGKPLEGKHIIEVPEGNLNAVNRAEFERLARERGFEIRYAPE